MCIKLRIFIGEIDANDLQKPYMKTTRQFVDRRCKMSACIRTTVELPVFLAEQADDAVRRKVARNRNALIIQALEEFLERLQQQQIDKQIAQMAYDQEYQNLQLEMVEEYEQTGWEALQIGEKQL